MFALTMPLVAQEAAAPEQHQQTETIKGGPNQPVEVQEENPVEASKAAVGKAARESVTMRWISKHLGVSEDTAYWISFVFDFAILAILLGVFIKKGVPTLLRARTESIRRNLDEARAASAEANRRLKDVEARLQKIDGEIAQMQAAAETEVEAEAERIKAEAEQERRKIIETAEQEIEAAAKHARSELKVYAAELAVSLAERRIHVDASTDEALVRSFVSELGEPGKDGNQ
jgi:F-type H+-transporting ATPase subunit b